MGEGGGDRAENLDKADCGGVRARFFGGGGGVSGFFGTGYPENEMGL